MDLDPDPGDPITYGSGSSPDPEHTGTNIEIADTVHFSLVLYLYHQPQNWKYAMQKN
jgi:hypothetical protein